MILFYKPADFSKRIVDIIHAEYENRTRHLNSRCLCERGQRVLNGNHSAILLVIIENSNHLKFIIGSNFQDIVKVSVEMNKARLSDKIEIANVFFNIVGFENNFFRD